MSSGQMQQQQRRERQQRRILPQNPAGFRALTQLRPLSLVSALKNISPVPGVGKNASR